MLYNQRFKPQKLKKYAKVQGGYAFKSSEYTGSGIPIVRIGDLKSNTVDIENCVKVSNSYLDTCKNFIIKDNELLIAMTGATVGKVAFVKNFKTHLLLNQRVGRFICDSTKIDSKYLYYVTSAQEFYNEVQILATGAGQPNISPMQIENINIPVPDSIEEQQEIVQVLDTMSDIIRLRKECISHAQDLIPALFQEMFGNPLKNKTPFKIGQFYNVGTGATPRRENESYYIGNNPWVKTTEVNNCYIEQTEEHISDEAISKTNCTLYEPNTIIMAMYGQGKTRGKVAYLKVSATTNQACAALQLKENYKDEINNIFVFYYLQFIYNYLRTLSQGGGRPNMNLSIVRNIPLYKPDIKLQNIFANKVLEIENYIKEQQEELANAKQMFQSLLHHAFTGELTRRAYGED